MTATDLNMVMASAPFNSSNITKLSKLFDFQAFMGNIINFFKLDKKINYTQPIFSYNYVP